MCGLGVWGAVLALLAAWPCRDPVIWPSLLGVLALVYYIPKWVLVYLLNRRRMLLRDQLVTACIALANTARAGVTLPRGLQDVSRETPMPLRAELREIVHAFLLGRTVHEAVGDVQKRLRIDTFDIFTAILLVCHERGGNLAIALDSLAHSLQENQRLEEEACLRDCHRQGLALGHRPGPGRVPRDVLPVRPVQHRPTVPQRHRANLPGRLGRVDLHQCEVGPLDPESRGMTT